jgi:hypothetical protein
MLQEINLYLLLPQEKKSFLTLRLMTLSYSLFIFFLAVNFCFGLWRNHQMVLLINGLNQQVSRIEARLMEIHNQYPMLDPKDMETSLKQLQQELEGKNNIFNLLSRNRNFSTYLVGIAKAAVDNLWLVDIQIEMNDKDLILKGRATQAAAIQNFINKLALQTEFAGLNFQLQDVHKVENPKETGLDFTISTKMKAENEA